MSMGFERKLAYAPGFDVATLKQMTLEKQIIHPCSICAHEMHSTRTDDTLFFQCAQCGRKERSSNSNTSLNTLCFSLTAFIFFIASNFLPFMTFELYGNSNTSTLLGGIQSLLQSGAWFVAVIVFLASLVIPFFKIMGLVFLTLPFSKKYSPHLRTRLYLFIEAIGRWSMLDIFLLAVLVATVKLGNWAQVKVEAGSFLFLLVVILTMLASKNFDPRLIWEGHKK